MTPIAALFVLATNVWQGAPVLYFVGAVALGMIGPLGTWAIAKRYPETDRSAEPHPLMRLVGRQNERLFLGIPYAHHTEVDMGFLDKAKREKKEGIRQRKAMQSARKRIYGQCNGMVRKLLGQLGEETWGTRLLGKYHVGKVELGKEFELEAGPWGWYVGKGRKGKSSVPYGLGTSAPGEVEVYGVLVSFRLGDLSRACFAVIYGELGKIGTLFTPDLSQAALQEALAEAFRSGPLDLGIPDQGVNVTLYNVLRNCELTTWTEEIREYTEVTKRAIEAEVLKRALEEATSKSSTHVASPYDSQIEAGPPKKNFCSQCGNEVMMPSDNFCRTCGAKLR